MTHAPLQPAAPVTNPPMRRAVLLAALAGVVLAVVWSPALVDRVIAGGLAGPVLGGDIANLPISGSGMVLAFAFVTGVAGMFTACNVAVFSALGPLTTTGRDSGQLSAAAQRVGLLVLGAVAVGATSGAVGVLVGGSPQLSDARIGDPVDGLPVRILQAGLIFGAIGAVMLWRGLCQARVLRDPLASLLARRPWAEPLMLGGLVGAFLVGRPFPPFRHLFGHAVQTGDPLLGAAAFGLQSLGNVVGVVLLFGALTVLTRGRWQAWLTRVPGRADRFAAVSYVTVGTFLLVYWLVRMGERAGVMWWPVMPYNA